MFDWLVLSAQHGRMGTSPRWLTCTPVRFPGDESFFARDSGLLCRGFQALGVPCQAVMPGPPLPGDCTRDLIRTAYRNLESPPWWRATGAEGVVLYAWGAARYFPVARAIRQAGLKLVCNLDTSGTFGILGGPLEYWGALWRIQNGLGISPRSLTVFGAKFLSSFTWSLLKHDLGRSRHLHQADLIGAVSPLAVERIRRVCRWYGGEALASRVRLIPHPVAMVMTYSNQIKKPRVVTVGRWTPEAWRQKNPFLLSEVATRVLHQNPRSEFVVVGAMEEGLRRRMLESAGSAADRIRITGRLSHPNLVDLYQVSQVSLCTSNHESFHISSAEALCCGCSVVAPSLPELPSFAWFTSEASGRLAARHPSALARAVLDELALWSQAGRDASQIAPPWCRRLHADRVAAGLLDQLPKPAAGESRIPRG